MPAPVPSRSAPPRSWSLDEYRLCLAHGLGDARSGNLEGARYWLTRAARLRPHEPQVWVALAEIETDLELKEQHLAKALQGDPFDMAARRALAVLKGHIDPAGMLPVGETVDPQNPESPAEAPTKTFLCDQCGGRMQYDIPAEGLRCDRCGQTQPLETQRMADQEQPLDWVLPTPRAHRWVEFHHLVACDPCGAISLLPPTQLTHRCPCCGSDALLAPPEGVGLIPPQGIIPMSVQAHEATELLYQWLTLQLGEDQPHAQTIPLRPAYYPLWCFAATYQSRRTNTAEILGPRTAVADGLFHFDDVLVLGTSKIPDALIEMVTPFHLNAAVAFDAAFLAGWPAVMYDCSLADASIAARGKMADSAHRQQNLLLERERQPGQFFDISYKQLFLPLWVGGYTLYGEPYQMLINGQTGLVGGTVPPQRVSRPQAKASPTNWLGRIWRNLLGG